VSQSLTIETGDIDETGPFPLPLTAKAPLGSLIYDPTVSGTIASVADADDFESGSLGPQWATSSSTPQGRIQVTGAFGTARGAFALLMDTAVSAPNNGNEAIWTVDLSGETEALLVFSHADFNDEENPLPPDFIGSASGDGVSISDDGVSWHTVLNATPGGFGVWNQVSVDLAAAAVAAGMTLGPDFQIKFQQFDNFPLTTDGRGYDHVSILVPGDDTDTFTVEIDPGQIISVVVETDPSLQATVELADGSNLLASATAEAPGADVLLQTVDTRGRLAGNGPQPRVYSVTIAGSGNTFGDYTAQIILNAAVEDERYGWPTNDALDTAQDIEASFIPLLRAVSSSTSGPQPDRGAVLGTMEASDLLVVDADDFESGSLGPQWATSSSTPQGRIQVTGAFGAASGAFALLMDTTVSGPNNGNEAIWTVDLSGETDALLVFSHADFNDEENPLPPDFIGSASGDGVSISDDGVSWHTVLNATPGGFGVWNEVSVDLAAAADAAGMTLGPDFQIKFQQFDDFPLTTDGRGYDQIEIVVPLSVADVYAFGLEAGETATLAVTSHTGGELHLELLDSSGAVVAEGLGAAELIENGSFESGGFNGWTVAETGAPFQPWQVTVGGFGDGFGIAPTSPQDGSFAAWNGFDGDGPMQFTMFQDVTIPADAPAATLRWQDRVQWDFLLGGFASLPRLYEVEIRDPGSNALLATVFSFSTGTQATNPTGDTGWQTHTADLSAFVGSTIRLVFREDIPQSFTGPGQIEFDAISLGAGERSTNVSDLIRGFSAAGSDTYFARVTGDADTDYSLVVTRNAGFDLEDNDDLNTAQTIVEPQAAGRRWVLGHVSGATLYGANRSGALFTIDLATAAGASVGNLPSSSTEIEYDGLTGRAFSQLPDGAFAGQEFDIATGAGIGAPIFNGAAFTGQEFVASTLYATAIMGPGGLSTLRILDPFAGTSVIVGPTGVGPISGLAWDGAAGLMYGIAGGPAPANLYTIDLGTGAATLVGSTGFQAGSLEFGPDGALYGGGTGTSSGSLFRIDPATGASTLVGATGFPSVTGLALVTSGGSDFYAVTLGQGGNLKAETYTPAVKSGEFVNEFDPSLFLYDASGNLVASDDNSASDGRNARLNFHTGGNGGDTYFIEVTSSDGSSGEYILAIK
jgi:hypothetical protein